MTENNQIPWYQTRAAFGALTAMVALGAAGIAALLMNISDRKTEGKQSYVPLVELTENDTDPEKWGRNWPIQYDLYKKTALRTQTRFGGHAGSEALPEEKIERDPWLKRMFLGYAFSIDYRDRRGHAYMLSDQENTERLTKPQSGSCLHCHASIMPLYRELGGGNAMKGFESSYQYSYQELNKKLHDSGHAHPVSCVDCHDPESMQLRVTRPGFINAMAELAASEAPVPAIPSIDAWRQGSRKQKYDPNLDSTRTEMRAFVCGQCHVEYYCSSKMPLTFPWGDGLSVDDAEKYWDEAKFVDGTAFVDYKHKETGAPILKAQHPEFELWSQGVHARAGVTCSDCHMPYIRQGASKVSDHWVRSPLLNINRACQSCHRASESELAARVDNIQSKNYELLQRGGAAVVDLIESIVEARAAGVNDESLTSALSLQRRAQWRLDYIAAENSMGFHAPQEAARILGEAADYARQGQVEALRAMMGSAPDHESDDGEPVPAHAEGKEPAAIPAEKPPAATSSEKPPAAQTPSGTAPASEAGRE